MMAIVLRRGVVWCLVAGASLVALPGQAPGQGVAPSIAPGAALIRQIEAHQGAVAGLAFSLDGDLLATGSADSTVRIWQVESGELALTLGGDGGPVSCVAFSPDGRWLASGSADNVIRIWDASTGELVRTLSGHTALVSAVAFGPTGRFLVSGGADGTVRLWDLIAWQPVRSYPGHAAKVSSVAVSPDGEWIASGSWDQSVRLWPMTSGSEGATRTLALSPTVVFDDVVVAFSSDGRRLIAGSRDRTVRVWETERFSELRRLEGHDDAVVALATSADGRLLASASDSTLHIWNLESGTLVQVLRGHQAQVYGVAFSPDGFLASGAQDATVRLWLPHLDPEVITGDSALRVAFAPKDQFESTEAFRQRLLQAQRRYPLASRRVARRRANTRAMRILASRQPVEFGDTAIVLGAYDADREEYPVSVLGVSTVLKLAPERARQLFARREEFRGRAIEHLGEDGLTLQRSEIQLMHPVLTEPVPVGIQFADSAAAEAAVMARVLLPAELAIEGLELQHPTAEAVLAADDTATIRLRVRNGGRGPALAVRVTGTSSAPISGMAAFLGRIDPGEALAVRLTLRTGALADSVVTLRLRVREANGYDAPPVELTVRARPRATAPPDRAGDRPRARASG